MWYDGRNVSLCENIIYWYNFNYFISSINSSLGCLSEEQIYRAHLTKNKSK